MGDRFRDIFATSSMHVALYDPTAETITFPYNVERGTHVAFRGAFEFGTGSRRRSCEPRSRSILGTWQDLQDHGGVRDASQDERYVGVPIL